MTHNDAVTTVSILAGWTGDDPEVEKLRVAALKRALEVLAA